MVRPTEITAERGGASRALGLLLLSAAAVGVMSEMMVGALEEAAHDLGMNQVFVGVILVALVGNAAEHSTAVLMAAKNKMDLSVNIAVGSSIQIAMFVAPLLVFLSYAIGPAPMDLHFTSLEVVAVVSVGRRNGPCVSRRGVALDGGSSTAGRVRHAGAGFLLPSHLRASAPARRARMGNLLGARRV